MQIRKAVEEDIQKVAVLFDAYRTFYQQPSDIAAAEKFIAERLQQNESVILLAEDENKNAVGFTQLYPIFSSVSMRRTLLLNDLFVGKEARGSGIATLLLDAARQYAEEAGCKWLLLQTAADNYPAQALYEKSGWKKVNDFFYQFNV